MQDLPIPAHPMNLAEVHLHERKVSKRSFAKIGTNRTYLVKYLYLLAALFARKEMTLRRGTGKYMNNINTL
jgi:hypothetical protein